MLCGGSRRTIPNQEAAQVKLAKFSAIVVFSVLAAVYGCTNTEESSRDTPKGETAKANSIEVVAIEKAITDLAKSLTDFPKTRDKQSVLKFATKDYVGIQSGQEANPKEIDEYLSALLERINLGEPIGISQQVTNINTHVSGNTAWATYDFTYKLGRGGMPLEGFEGKCTAILRRESDVWLFQHEHCSSQTTRQQLEMLNQMFKGMRKR